MAKIALVAGGGGLCSPKGDYNFRVVDIEEDTSKGGNPMLKVTCVVVDEGGNDRNKFFDYLVLTADSLWKLTEFLKSCGQDADEGLEVDTDDIVENAVGWTGRVALKVEKYDGRDSNKVAAYLSSKEEDEFAK